MLTLKYTTNTIKAKDTTTFKKALKVEDYKTRESAADFDGVVTDTCEWLRGKWLNETSALKIDDLRIISVLDTRTFTKTSDGHALQFNPKSNEWTSAQSYAHGTDNNRNDVELYADRYASTNANSRCKGLKHDELNDRVIKSVETGNIDCDALYTLARKSAWHMVTKLATVDRSKWALYGSEDKIQDLVQDAVLYVLENTDALECKTVSQLCAYAVSKSINFNKWYGDNLKTDDLSDNLTYARKIAHIVNDDIEDRTGARVNFLEDTKEYKALVKRLEKIGAKQAKKVLELVGQGASNNEIAQALKVSASTVTNHIATIKRYSKDVAFLEQYSYELDDETIDPLMQVYKFEKNENNE